MKPKPNANPTTVGKTKTYIVHRKKGSPLQYIADRYVEDEKAGRVYFYIGDSQSKERFVFLSEVSGIDVERPAGPPLSRDEALAQLKAAGLSTADIFGSIVQHEKPKEKN
jgi:hypothetical protein